MPRGIPKDGKKRTRPKAAPLPVGPEYKTPKRGVGQGVGGGQPQKYTKEWIDNEADALREFIANDGGNYIGSFARQRGYHRQRISDFVKVSEKFLDAYKEAQQWQEEKFIMNALTRVWDPGFTAKVMSRVCTEEWKNSFDREESDRDITLNINVNRIQD